MLKYYDGKDVRQKGRETFPKKTSEEIVNVGRIDKKGLKKVSQGQKKIMTKHKGQNQDNQRLKAELKKNSRKSVWGKGIKEELEGQKQNSKRFKNG